MSVVWPSDGWSRPFQAIRYLQFYYKYNGIQFHTFPFIFFFVLLLLFRFWTKLTIINGDGIFIRIGAHQIHIHIIIAYSKCTQSIKIVGKVVEFMNQQTIHSFPSSIYELFFLVPAPSYQHCGKKHFVRLRNGSTLIRS